MVRKRRSGMIKSIFSISISIIRQNKLLTAGLIALFTILTTICLSANFISSSIAASIEKFNREYILPDAWFYTKPLTEPFSREELPSGVAELEAELTADIRLTDQSGETTYVTLFTQEESGFKKFYEIETAPVPAGAVPIRITVYYANACGIHAGDLVTVAARTGEAECFVEALVSCPESVKCKRSGGLSWLGTSDYGYVYISRAAAKEAFHIPDVSNVYSVLFDDALDEAGQRRAFRETEEFFGEMLEESVIFADSPLKKNLDNELSKMKIVGTYLPIFAFAIGICFTLMFMYQIIRKQRRNIGFLMALGYRDREILSAFLLYSEIVSVIGILIGIGSGMSVISYSLRLAQQKHSLPFTVCVPDLPGLIVSAVFLLVSAAAACLICVGKITEVDPAEAFGEDRSGSDNRISKLVSGLKLSSVVKFSAVSIARNKNRLLASALSAASSIMLMTVGLSLYASNAAREKAVFGGRYRYDYLVQHEESGRYSEDIGNIDGVSAAEPVSAFLADVSAGEKTQTGIQINAIRENSALIVPEDADGKPLSPGEGIILDEYLAKKLGVRIGDSVSVGDVPLRVTGIARERVNCIQYISFDTAKKTGHGLPNQTLIRCAENADTRDIKNRLAGIPGFRYLITLEHQHTDMNSDDRLINMLILLTLLLMTVLGSILICIMVVLSIDENKKDYAVLNALGIRASSLILISFLENGARYLLSVFIGIPCGIAVSAAALSEMGSLKSYYPLTDPGTICLVSSGIALLYLVLGMIVSVTKALRVDPAVTLNT